MAKNLLARLLIRIKADRPIWIGRPGWYGLCVSSITISLWWLSQFVPAWVENFYSRGLYLLFTHTLAALTETINSPLTEPLFALLVVVIFLNLIRFWVWPDRYELVGWRLVAKALVSTLSLIGVVIALGLVLWGFNYYRFGVDDLIRREPLLSQSQWRQTLNWAVENTNETRSLISSTVACNVSESPDLQDLEKQVQVPLIAWFERFDLPMIELGRSQYFVQSDLAKELNIEGLYNPFLAQPSVGRFSHPLILPYVVTTLRIKLNGFAYEQDARLIAYLSLWRADQVELRYAAWLYFWDTIGRTNGLDSRVNRDLDCIQRFDAQWHPQRLTVQKIMDYPVWQKVMTGELPANDKQYSSAMALQYFFYNE